MAADMFPVFQDLNESYGYNEAGGRVLRSQCRVKLHRCGFGVGGRTAQRPRRSVGMAGSEIMDKVRQLSQVVVAEDKGDESAWRRNCAKQASRREGTSVKRGRAG